ncbi:MAG: hypothetical protein ABL967_03150 [Bryobacteraceae bacterium]
MTESPAGSTSSLANDDMDDRAEIALLADHPELQRVSNALRFCQSAIEPKFRAADAESLHAQRTYLRYANAAAVSGVLAILFGIFQMAHLGDAQLENWSPKYGPWVLPVLELVSACTTVVVALAGLGGQKQQSWFLTRFRAEQLRLLKFHLLTNPHLWPGDGVVPEKDVRNTHDRIDGLTNAAYSDLESWIARGTVPSVLEPPPTSEPEWREIREYYDRNRLQRQIHYFHLRRSKNLHDDQRTRILPPIFFFGSVAFVLVHFCIEVAVSGEHGHPMIATIALVISAALPSLGALIRVTRGVLEYARNASRCESTHHALSALAVRLRDASTAEAAFREIGFAEQVLESDLREWLRLMVESEWFG